MQNVWCTSQPHQGSFLLSVRLFLHVGGTWKATLPTQTNCSLLEWQYDRKCLAYHHKQEADIERLVRYGVQADKQMFVRLPLQHLFEK